MHPDFEQRIIAWYDAVGHRRDPYDWNGHGTQEGVIFQFSGRA